METYTIEGRSFNGHLALPKAGKGIGLLVFHGWWGLNPFIIQTCDMLAQKGFAALAPDY